MSTDFSGFPCPSLHCASNGQSSSLSAIDFQRHGGCRAGRVINGIVNCDVAVLLCTCCLCGTADNGSCIAFDRPHDILFNCVAGHGFSIDFCGHGDFYQMCAVGLCRNSISQLSAGNAACGRAKNLSINRKVDSFCNIAIRSVAEGYLSTINQRIIKRTLQIELNNIDSPSLCTNTAHAIGHL